MSSLTSIQMLQATAESNSNSSHLDQNKIINDQLAKLDNIFDSNACFSKLFPSTSHVNHSNSIENFVYKTLLLSARTGEYIKDCAFEKRLSLITRDNFGLKNAFYVLLHCYRLTNLFGNAAAAAAIRAKLESLLENPIENIAFLDKFNPAFEWNAVNSSFTQDLQRAEEQKTIVKQKTTTFSKIIAGVGLSLAVTAFALYKHQGSIYPPPSNPDLKNAKNSNSQSNDLNDLCNDVPYNDNNITSWINGIIAKKLDIRDPANMSEFPRPCELKSEDKLHKIYLDYRGGQVEAFYHPGIMSNDNILNSNNCENRITKQDTSPNASFYGAILISLDNDGNVYQGWNTQKNCK